MLSTTSDYALRAVLALAAREGQEPMRADQVADEIGAPRNYLAKTLNALAKAGIVTSARGPLGGFTLAVAPESLSVARIVDCFDEPKPHTRCMLGTGPCDPSNPCAAHAQWMHITEARRAPLVSTTIADMLRGAHTLPIRLETHMPKTASLSMRPVIGDSATVATLAVLALLASASLTGCVGSASARESGATNSVPVRTASDKIEGSERAVITDAPNVPPPITRTHATKVVVDLDVIEKTMRLADSVTYTMWTFGGSVPGKFIRVREGDLVEMHLNNAKGNTMPHNIDLHAVTGPGGGAKTSLAIPGHDAVFTFTALNPGLFVYHCATSPVPMHIANGMYGLILVEPKAGLAPVDREFYVMQSEFYTTGKFGEPGLQTLDVEKGIDERPTYVVFNGSVGAMTGERALKAKVGERVRLFVGNAGPNLTSSFHVIGEVFDNVYTEGSTSTPAHNVQTTSIPAGGSAIVEFGVEKPGELIMVDHAIFRAFNKGAIGMIDVTGPDNARVFSAIKGLGVPAPAHAMTDR